MKMRPELKREFDSYKAIFEKSDLQKLLKRAQTIEVTAEVEQLVRDAYNMGIERAQQNRRDLELIRRDQAERARQERIRKDQVQRQ